MAEAFGRLFGFDCSEFIHAPVNAAELVGIV